MEKTNKLSLPATILIASIILGGFYYAAEINKQKSIERQQKINIENEKRIEDEKAAKDATDALRKRLCVNEVIQNAEDFYKANCTYDCKEGQYYVANYDNAYTTCLQRYGLK